MGIWDIKEHEFKQAPWYVKIQFYALFGTFFIPAIVVGFLFEFYPGLWWPVRHLEKFFSPSRCESDSLTAMGHGRMERASHGADGLFRC